MSDKWLDELTNQHVRELIPYQSARRLFSAKSQLTANSNAQDNKITKQLWLNANESPSADQFELDSSHFNRYPDCQPEEVISAYASYAKLQSEQIVCTRGADEGIELIIRAFCEAGLSKVLVCPPTYGMYAISAQTFNVGVELAPLKSDFSLDLHAMEQCVGKVNVVFLCSPNNPTGTRLKQKDIIAVLRMFAGKALVVLDEAYIEFDISEQQTELLKSYPNLIILRTLSKAFALAGIRCGFVLSSSAICTSLMKVIAPYPIAAPVAQIAAQALSNDGLASMEARVEHTQSSIESITTRLNSISDISLVGDTKANFVLFKSAKNKELMQYLVENGIIIRDQSKQVALQDCLRITTGSEKENQSLLAAIDDFFARQNKAQADLPLNEKDREAS